MLLCVYILFTGLKRLEGDVAPHGSVEMRGKSVGYWLLWFVKLPDFQAPMNVSGIAASNRSRTVMSYSTVVMVAGRIIRQSTGGDIGNGQRAFV